VKFCSLSTQFLPPCPLAKPSYLKRVYGATILTIAIMQNESLRSFLGARSIVQSWKAVLPHLPDALANHLRTRERDRPGFGAVDRGFPRDLRQSSQASSSPCSR